MDVQPRNKHDVERLQILVSKERQAKQRDRYRIAVLALQGLEALQIADKVGYSRQTVQQWVYRYRDEGLDGLRERPRSGQPKKLPTEKEADSRQRLEDGPIPADGVVFAGAESDRAPVGLAQVPPVQQPHVYGLRRNAEFRHHRLEHPDA